MSLLTKKRPSRILKSPNNSVTVFYRISNPFYLLPCSGQGMLPSEESFFKNGKVNKEALVDFIKTIKKNTNLSDEDAAIMAASKVFHLIISWPWNLTNLSFFVLQREKSLVDVWLIIRWWTAGRKLGFGIGSMQRGTWREEGKSNQPSRWMISLKR